MNTVRVTWEAIQHGKPVSPPYYNAAAALRVARTVAKNTGEPVEVTRDGRPYRWIEP